MSLEQSFAIPEHAKIERPINPEHRVMAEQFLGDAIGYLSPESIDSIVVRAQELEVANDASFAYVTYNKYKKEFLLGKSVATKGQIISSRHFGTAVTLPDSLDQSFEGKTLRATYIQKLHQDFIVDELNKLLAESLARDIEHKDVLKAKAYTAIAERSGADKETNEQLGVIAEKLIYGVAEMISIDRPDLGITVHAANAYQDVEEKIDFIIATSHKKRGAGIETKDLEGESQEKHIGIQFTINTSKESHKRDQIARAKERGIDVDDIVYLAIDSTLLRKAIGEWEKAGKPVSGPWAYLPTDAKHKAVSGLFQTMITPEQEASLLKQM